MFQVPLSVNVLAAEVWEGVAVKADFLDECQYLGRYLAGEEGCVMVSISKFQCVW